MGLPPYSGPFKVGALDLEIPVRQPRNFCSNVVDPGELNRPAHKIRRRAKELHQETKKRRQEKHKEEGPVQQQPQAHVRSASDSINRPEGESENGTASASTSEINPSASPRATTVSDAAEAEQEAAENEATQQDQESAWSPWSSGSKTCTLYLDTVLFTMYYPTSAMSRAEEKRYPKAAWLGRPVHTGVEALLQYVGQYGIFAVPASPAIFTLINAHMPARVGFPLADPEELRHLADPGRGDANRAKTGNFGNRPSQFPVVIFSHGLAGNRLSYSQYCGELASHGIIVAAIEHRDGSGVSSIVRGEEAPDKAKQTGLRIPQIIGHKSSGRQKASVPYLAFEKLGLHSFTEDPSEREVNLRRDQIKMRQAEIEETLYVLGEINAGRGYEIAQKSTRNLGTKLAGHAASAKNRRLPSRSLLKAERPLADWKGKFDLEYPTVCGHSFGGATVIELMRRENPFPLAIVLDPWVEPVRDPAKEEDEVKGRLEKPIYVLNSESFTVWEDHFEKLKRICLDGRKTSGRGWLLTLTGSKHTDFSDYPFLLPTMFKSTVGPSHTIEVFSKATYMQMGLSRQRFRERQDRPGYKLNKQGSYTDCMGHGEEDDAESSGGGSHRTNPRQTVPNTDQVPAPTNAAIEAGKTQVLLAPRADHQSGLGQRGKDEATENMVHSPTSNPERSAERDEAVNANRSRTPDSTSHKHDARPEHVRAQYSHQDLRNECAEDHAASGQEAREKLVARHGRPPADERAAKVASQKHGGHEIDYITDVSDLEMIDADQDVQTVHKHLEGVADKFENKSKWLD